MIKYTKLLLLLGASATLALSSCKKKCDIPDTTNSGEIIEGAIVYPSSGYMTSSLTPDRYLITEDHSYSNRFEVSFDGGHTKLEMDHSKYAILAYPIQTTCNASFSRNVTIDDANGIIIYTIKGVECSDCKETRSFENYVLIRDVPSSYTVLYDVDMSTK